ncbi:hypothetical protein PHLH7_26060 [Pseudomonas sp. Ost2]|uniref:hypothetical protein n=1 Tax=Pseudomonas sp. Ost2 TaxID=2678260 RepID=UPI001BB43561|nr:hypothetical protein [Pseudomonas sp. Ost2]BBP76502.1 hypothetical protein PHLH7_26060 [Pseudomonas sp. Ost2]
MSHNFKPGDLALVISGGCLGETAELVRFVMPGDLIVSPTTGKLYEFRPTAGVGGWLCKFACMHAVKHEKNLMPLRGDFTHEQQKAKEAV